MTDAGTELVLRVAGPADAPALKLLVQSAYRGDESRAGWTTEADHLEGERITVAGVEAKITGEHGAVLLIEPAGSPAPAPIGCCEVQYQGDGLAYFGMFAVRPDLQAAGLGRRLLAAAEDHAVRTWGATEMEMTVINGRAELVAWYERRGYQLTGETRPFPVEEINARGRVLREDIRFEVLTKKLTPRLTEA